MGVGAFGLPRFADEPSLLQELNRVWRCFSWMAELFLGGAGSGTLGSCLFLIKISLWLMCEGEAGGRERNLLCG